MSAEFIEVLHLANQRLSGYLDRLSSRRQDELPTTAAELQAVSGLIEQVAQAGRSTTTGGDLDKESGAEFAQYTENLRRLKDLLERLQPELEQRRADLRASCTKLQAALEWATTVKQTSEN
jgi:hypothetical protein